MIEQVRYIESATPLVSANDCTNDCTNDCGNEKGSSDHSKYTDFEQLLWQRARAITESCNLSHALERAGKTSHRVNTLALFAAALFGAFGVFVAITDTHTINIYWLLLILLGFNLLSMSFWFIGLAINVRGSVASLLAAIMARSVNAGLVFPADGSDADSRSDAQNAEQVVRQANRAWLAVNFSGTVGKWWLSKITHQLWLAYLLSGLVFLVLLLMLRQYDFVWGTTLLSDSAFLKLTDILSVPLDALGFSTPTADQVQQTRIGAEQILTAEHRYNWAQFLLGALLCFGILPRVVLLVLSALMCFYARRRFTLDYYLPYYVHLRQQLMPLASHGQIVDADEAPPVTRQQSDETCSEYRDKSVQQTAGQAGVQAGMFSGEAPLTASMRQLPDETLWVAVELGSNISWPPANVSHDLGQVIDRESLKQVQQQLQNTKNAIVAVTVSAARPPDRGVQRTICQLMTGSRQRWLVLLGDGREVVSEARMAAWYRLAESCQVPADHVISMSVE